MPELLTLREGAERANVSFPTFRRWLDRGEIPAFRFGKIVRIDAAALEAFIEARTLPAKQS